MKPLFEGRRPLVRTTKTAFAFQEQKRKPLGTSWCGNLPQSFYGDERYFRNLRRFVPARIEETETRTRSRVSKAAVNAIWVSKQPIIFVCSDPKYPFFLQISERISFFVVTKIFALSLRPRSYLFPPPLPRLIPAVSLSVFCCCRFNGAQPRLAFNQT